MDSTVESFSQVYVDTFKKKTDTNVKVSQIVLYLFFKCRLEFDQELLLLFKSPKTEFFKAKPVGTSILLADLTFPSQKIGRSVYRKRKGYLEYNLTIYIFFGWVARIDFKL